MSPQSPDEAAQASSFGTFQVELPSNGSPPRKRKRKTYSCTPCRIRKLKCDRQQPCKCCADRQEESGCAYGQDLAEGQPPSSTTNGPGLKLGFHFGSIITDTPETEKNGLPTPLSVGNNSSLGASTRPGSTHWSVLMNDIEELKDLRVSDPGHKSKPSRPDFSTETMFSPRRPCSLEMILTKSLPPKTLVDRRLSAYFNARYMVSPFLHKPLFKRQYEEFWQHPFEVSPMWLSMLFSICCIGAHIIGLNSSNSAPDDPESYLRASTQALVLGDYYRPQPFVIEAIMFHAQCKGQWSKTSTPSEQSLIMSVLCRLCYQMELHHDPSHFSSVSVFEGEMRRRTWALVSMYEMMSSFQLGLPSNISPDTWDTKPPLNIQDDDFDENCTTLPTPRPRGDASQMLYFVTKTEIVKVFGKVCRLEYCTGEVSLSEICALNQAIRHLQDSLPPVLRMTKISESYTDEPYVLMLRLNLAVLLHKSLLVLHRKRMARGDTMSAEICIDAATTIVNDMGDYAAELEQGGVLFGSDWMITGFALNDLLLSVMILCLSLSQWKQKNPNHAVMDDAKMRARVGLIRRSISVTTDTRLATTESRRVAALANKVLSSLKAFAAITNPVTQPTPHAPPKPNTHNQLLPNGQESEIPELDRGASMSWPFPEEVDMPQEEDLSQSQYWEPFFQAMNSLDWTTFDRSMAFPDQDYTWGPYNMYNGGER